MQFFDWNGRRLRVATGAMFRPLTIISSGPGLNIRFYANGASNKGFKVAYTFLLPDSDTKFIEKLQMSCGGLVDNLGGGITMMNVVKESTQSFDCVWIVQPSRNFLHFYKHLYVKVVAFSDFEGTTELSLHQGATSSGEKLEILKYPFANLGDLRQDEHVISITEGFYIRFKGILRAESKLAIAYTAFSYKECIPGTDFLCKNQRCIPIYLQCDGFDHCGDNSDEPTSCFQDLKNRRWFHTSNFFFPKTDQYSDFHTAAIIFLVCSFGMISLILALIIIIFRINGRVRQQREMENHLQEISDLLVQDTPSILEEMIEEDDPPVYEFPPNYTEVGSTLVVPNNQRRPCRRPVVEGGMRNLSAFRRGTCSRCSQRLGAKLAIKRSENSSIDEVGTSRGSQIPDSPPPAYVYSTSSSTQIVSELNNSPQGISDSLLGPALNSFNIILQNSGPNAIENKQSFLAKHFSNDDFNTLKKKRLQKSKTLKICSKLEHAKKFFPNFCESDLIRYLSDSELSEINSMGAGTSEESSAKLQRSFSFDDL